MGLIRVLLLADSHLGFDLPFKPRVQRRRRGHDFFNNFNQALEPARAGEVDCVVHGGDLLYRSKVPPELVAMAFAPLHEIAANGVPVYLVPGNHERSKIPFSLLARAPEVYIFDRPRTFLLEKPGFSLALSGFPYVRDDIRGHFLETLSQTKWEEQGADCHILCIHQCVEGASVGPSDYTFRCGPGVIKTADIPTRFSAVLSGHIHRAQALTRDLKGVRLRVPVIYPGSIERTSFAEKDESKGFFIIEIDTADVTQPRWKFRDLYARPMIEMKICPAVIATRDLVSHIRTSLLSLPEDSIVKLSFMGDIPTRPLQDLSAVSLRSLAPPSMNLSVRFLASSGR